MFKLSTSFILAAVSILGCATVASTSPTPLDARAEDASATAEMCAGSNLSGICFDIAISGNCVNLNGGPYDALYKEISSAFVPGGAICTLYENLGCLSAPNATDVAILIGRAGGTRYPTFTLVPGRHGLFNFIDKTSSLRCSAPARAIDTDGTD